MIAVLPPVEWIQCGTGFQPPREVNRRKEVVILVSDAREARIDLRPRVRTRIAETAWATAESPRNTFGRETIDQAEGPDSFEDNLMAIEVGIADLGSSNIGVNSERDRCIEASDFSSRRP